MELAFREAWAGREKRAPACPTCGGERLRYSRRQYEGIWARIFRLRPARCLDCGAYFPVSQDAAILSPQVDPADLHVPFWPLEMEERAERDSAAAIGWTPRDARTPRVGARKVCPLCGSEDVRPSKPGGEEPPLGVLDVTVPYRCVSCNGSFRRVVPTRLAAIIGLVAALLTGLILLGRLITGARASRPQAPRIKKGQIPNPPPPVFR